jgi:cysteine synthase B
MKAPDREMSTSAHLGSGVAKMSILEAIGDTPTVELSRLNTKAGVKLYAKLEGQNPTGSVKDRIAKYMIDDAEAQGLLTHDHTVLEPTSGNTGISLAMVCKLKGYRLKVVMPENVSPERAQLLLAYGAEVVLSDGAGGTNRAITVAQEMFAKDPDLYYMPYQYGNAANPLAHYETTGVEILEAVPNVDVFVAGLGTGGTLMGVGRRLKERNPDTKIVAVVPHPDDLIMGLRSLEDGFIPPILDESLLDSRIMIESREAFQMTRALLDQEGIFAGISAGGVVACAMRLAQRMETGNVVCLLADGGWKYLSTNLWSREYGDLEAEVKGKIWW